MRLVEAGAMPLSRRLKIHNCSRLAALPEGLRHIAAVMDLALLGIPRRICSRTKNERDDWPTIQHVRSITIRLHS